MLSIINKQKKGKKNSMRLLDKLKNLIKVADFFYSTQMLRYDEDLQYKTLTGGIVSLAIIVTILVGFASMIINTMELNTFTISTEIVKNKVPTPSVVQINQQSSFRFAIQIWRQNITDTKRFFDITFRHQHRDNGVLNKKTYIPLQPCTKSYFQDFPQITNNFQSLQSSKWLCPPLNTTLNPSGKYSSANYNQYIIAVQACKNETDPSRPCASPQEIEKYFLQNQNFFYFTFYFTNTQINPDKKDYKQYYIEDQSYSLFGSNVGCETFLYFTDYTVQTDESIWPFSNVVTDSGVYAQDLGINHPFETHINGTYITWNIAKSTNSITYSRQVQKLSVVFSFMGGMIGAVSAILFIIKVYTNVAFQFSIAFEIFKQRPETSNVLKDKKVKTYKKIQQMSINFFNFVAFHVYQFFDLIGYKYNSPKIQYAKQCKEEILKQLDVKKLLKRIIFIEHCLTNILDDYQLDALQMKRPQSPDYVRQIRLKCQSIVDHQQGSTEKLIKSQLKQAKEECISRQDQINIKDGEQQTPSAIVKYEEKQSSKTNKEKKYLIGLQKENIQLQAKNEVIVFDLDDEKMEKVNPLEASEHIFAITRTKKIENSFRKQVDRQKKRESNLMKLLNNAQLGDEISNRIWKKLDKDIKMRTKTMLISRQDFE